MKVVGLEGEVELIGEAGKRETGMSYLQMAYLAYMWPGKGDKACPKKRKWSEVWNRARR